MNPQTDLYLLSQEEAQAILGNVTHLSILASVGAIEWTSALAMCGKAIGLPVEATFDYPDTDVREYVLYLNARLEIIHHRAHPDCG